MEERGHEKKFVVFRLEKEYYGIDILHVKNLERITSITRIPNSPDYVKGVINLRGDVVPVLDMRTRFSLPSKEMTNESRIIVCQQDDIVIGMIVDNASEVLTINATQIDDAPRLEASVDKDFVSGVAKIEKRLVILINLKEVIGLAS